MSLQLSKAPLIVARVGNGYIVEVQASVGASGVRQTDPMVFLSLAAAYSHLVSYFEEEATPEEPLPELKPADMIVAPAANTAQARLDSSVGGFAELLAFQEKSIRERAQREQERLAAEAAGENPTAPG